MSEPTTVRDQTEEALEGIQSVFKSAEEEFEKLQNRVSEQRKDFEKAAQKRIGKVQRELEKTPIYKRLHSLRKDASKEVEQGVDRILSSLNIATSSDIKKLDRRLKQISKKLKDLGEQPKEATPSA